MIIKMYSIIMIILKIFKKAIYKNKKRFYYDHASVIN